MVWMFTAGPGCTKRCARPPTNGQASPVVVDSPPETTAVVPAFAPAVVERLAEILDERGITHQPAQGMMLADAPAAQVGEIALEEGIPLEHLSTSTSGLHELFMSLTTDRRTA